jgi:hypothetical protein
MKQARSSDTLPHFQKLILNAWNASSLLAVTPHPYQVLFAYLTDSRTYQLHSLLRPY